MNKASCNNIKIFRSIASLRQWRRECLLRQESVGFVPTMGALHKGHMALVRRSLEENKHTVLSIFVNPSQFAPHEDLDQYPRTFESDLEKLKSLGNGTVDAVFVPTVGEMYPSGINLEVSKQKGAFVNVLGCSEQLEGSRRPQFFRGVATVVTKLLHVVTPERVYFGQKDAQQCVVIKNLVKDLLIDTEVRIVPVIREANGLALSSRNVYLSDATKDKASIIYKSLKAGEEFYRRKVQDGPVRADDIISTIKASLQNSSLDYSLQYLAVSDRESLDDLKIVEPSKGALVSTALAVKDDQAKEPTRLLDCIILE
ncbi:Piso0_004219 [Millerozyma farinosa CBS 7064]|uniref:Pantoate--beta-alanine ligase n=1 Tax=Pichia sorbitophila (strain ATCC MYA-4447 / BCRC 22081 / CBS 7064 / NBRC 10061 / NRRL Y-12695) TaxID=559304 RepID=G8Y7T6_PICSO|nr:Piso0_004219 [Millerozyma farinosa CBS 7064]CCE84666.1 Piso0_004219 [Millerozyma farinosa CBS 7064]